MSTTDGEESVKRVRDPTEDDYNERQRLKEIWDERQNVREWRREISHLVGQSMSQSDGERHYHEELKQYIGVVHTLLIDVYAEEGGRKLWNEVSLGTQTIQPPAEIEEHVGSTQAHFQGLKSIIETPARRTVRFEGTISHYQRRNETVSATKDVTVPWHILDTAWMHLNAFLSKVGLEVGREDDDTDIIRGFDMSGDEPQAEYDTGEYTGDPDL